MRTALLLPALVSTALAASGCGGEDRPRLVTLGHSYVEGSDDVRPWPERAAELLDRDLTNAGSGGAEAKDVVEQLEEVDLRSEDVVVVQAMINDVRERWLPGVRGYEQALEGLLARLRVRADRVVVLVDPPLRTWFPPDGTDPEAVLDAYATATRRAAALHDATVLDLRRGWDVRRDLEEDGVHPSDAGADRIARAVADAVGARRPTRTTPPA